MLAHAPKLPYSGLTIIMSNQSRFDRHELLTATGGLYFWNKCLHPHFNRFQCDIRLKQDTRPLLPNTKCLLLLGEDALHSWCPATQSNTIFELRGYPLTHNNILVIASFLPQEAVDFKAYERTHNPLLRDRIKEIEVTKSGDEKKRKGITKNKNWSYWLRRDIEKVVKIIHNDGKLPQLFNDASIRYKCYPSSDDVCSALSNTKGKHLYFDIETDENLNITVFSFAFDLDSVFIVPVITHNYSHAYSCLHRIFKSLAIAIRDNTLVAHNGSGFDFFVLAHKYRIPIEHKVYDTMLAQVRCIAGYEYVDTVSGRLQIKDLEGKSNFYVWSWKNGMPFPSRVNWVRKTGEQQKIIRVHIWRRANRKPCLFKIDCTPDHKFLINGQWIEAKDLNVGQSLTKCPVSYTTDKKEYHRLDGKRAHIRIWEILHNKKVNQWDDVHHKDSDRWNNHPDNLERLTHSFHIKEHRNGKLAEGLAAHIKINGAWNKDTLKYKKISKEELVKLYESKMSQIDIARYFKCDQASVSRLMKRHGIKSRSLPQAQQLRRQNDKNCKVISVEYLEDKQDVYCMDVEDTHCFSSNGVIIHNCFPEVEKSLGHCLSLPWLFEPYHKDEANFSYGNESQARQLWAYCGKDVSSLIKLYKVQTDYAKTKAGLTDSINSVMSYCRSYLTCTLLGIHYSKQELEATMDENDRLMNQYIRFIRLLLSDKWIKTIRGTGKSSMAGSPKQCVRYFHTLLKYPVVNRTKEGEASLDKQGMFKLKLLGITNPIIDIVLAYRALAKESGSIKFQPWKEAV